MRESPILRLRSALEVSDRDGVQRVLARRVRLLHDSGDASGGAVLGRAAVADALVQLRARHSGGDVLLAEVNGEPGMIVRSDGAVLGVLSFAASRRSVHMIWATTSAEKLARWQHRAG